MGFERIVVGIVIVVLPVAAQLFARGSTYYDIIHGAVYGVAVSLESARGTWDFFI